MLSIQIFILFLIYFIIQYIKINYLSFDKKHCNNIEKISIFLKFPLFFKLIFCYKQQLLVIPILKIFSLIDLLGSGKKNTKIYKVEYLPTGKVYALKEVEAKNMEKLNEYKEEAVQLTKIQNNANIMNFYGYYFYETMYNTFRIALICEYLDQKYNLEILFRKRKQLGQFWTPTELRLITASLLQAMCFLQSVGICHRDIKPANLFILPNGSIKLIDFGESKDFPSSPSKKEDDVTMATIRGTPQYLSPILWKAHVVEGNTRHARHNIYKSDVFSSGLVLMQLALLEDVTGFNQKTQIHDGESLIKKALGQILPRYGATLCDIFSNMLRFDEATRPTFFELASRYLENSVSEDSTIVPPLKPLPGDSFLDNKLDFTHEVEIKEHEEKNNLEETKSGVKGAGALSLTNKKPIESLPDANNKKDSQRSESAEESCEKLMSQTELFKAYSQANNLFVNLTEFAYHFEFGGTTISQYNVTLPESRWRIIGKYKHHFSSHFIVTYTENDEFYLLGPNDAGSCLLYKKRRLHPRQNMLQEKSFFTATYLHKYIYIIWKCK